MKKTLIFILCTLLFSPVLMASQKVGGVQVPSSIQIDNDNLVLNGAGIRKKAFISLYVGALYLKEKSSNVQSIMDADEAMAIRLYIVSGLITKEKMLEAINDGFKAATEGNLAPLQERIDKLNAYFKDEIKDGDLIELAYKSESGLSMSKNGEFVGSIEGLDFKKALFAIWLGSKPADKGLQKAMVN